jgi:hypothetical protein
MKNAPVPIGLPSDQRDRLEKAVTQFEHSINEIPAQAIRAGVAFIEERDYRIDWPLNYQVVDTPATRHVHRGLLNGRSRQEVGPIRVRLPTDFRATKTPKQTNL